MLADYKLSILDRVTPAYFVNARRLRAAADAAGIEIIPAVFPIGLSGGLLGHDPNLEEGMSVEGEPFVVHDRGARLKPLAAPWTRDRRYRLLETYGQAMSGVGVTSPPARKP